jgi:uncharacterized membrane protein
MLTADTAATKEQAQERVDRIRLFRRELEEIERAGIVSLTDSQRESVRLYHDTLLERLAGQFDIDRTEGQKRMSLGMQVASLVGALAFSAAVFMFFYRFWGDLGVGAQVAILAAGPLVSVLGVHVAAKREKTLYFASILGLVAFACFVLDISMLASIFNMQDSPSGLLVWSAFAFALAYAYGLTWMLFLAVVMAAGFIAAELAQLAGISWGFFLMRPEGIMLAGAASLGMSAVEYDRDRPAFGGTYRFLGWVGVLAPVLLLVQFDMSYLPLPHAVAGPGYLVFGFALGAAATWLGIRQQSSLLVNTATLFLSLLLFVKLFDWWWDWMPRYLFFFLLGLIAVAILVLLRRLRLRIRRV